MKIKMLILTVLILVINTLTTVAQPLTPARVIKGVKEIKIASEILGETRTIFVYLPKQNKKSEFPVLYLLDGERIALYEEALKYCQNNPYIIVGIETRIDRNHDMVPCAVAGRNGWGAADIFLQFIADELIPFITKNYPSNGKNILYGASNAGLFTLNAILTEPELFSAYLAVSPTVGYCPSHLLQLLANFQKKERLKGKYLYLNYGTADPMQQVTAHVPGFYKKLSQNFGDILKLAYQELKGAEHVPPGSLTSGLEFIYPK